MTELVTNNIKKALPNNSQTESELAEPANKKKRFDIWGAYESIITTIRLEGRPDSQAILEVQRYLELPLIEKKKPSEWWRTFKHSFPNLAALARKRLNFMATSVPCERLFSGWQHFERKTYKVGCPQSATTFIFKYKL